MISDDYPALFQLLGYLHQDWVDEHATTRVDDVLAKALEDLPIKERQAAALELDDFIPRVRDASDPYEILCGVGCYYYTLADGLTAVEWLNHVRMVLRSSLNNRLA